MDLVFRGVEQAGPSFEARVFLNNPAADESTLQAPETGYAGSFHVYGYGEPAPPAIVEAKQKRGREARPSPRSRSGCTWTRPRSAPPSRDPMSSRSRLCP